MRKLFLIFGIFLMINFGIYGFTQKEKIQETLSKLGVKQALIDETIALDYEIRDTEYFENDEKRELTNYLPQIKIAGCPNSCATPQIAKLGFSGRRKKDGEYFAIFARGEFTGKTVKLNEIVGEIKASKIPYFLEDIANIIKEENIEFEEFVHEERFIELIEKYKEFELEVVDFNDFRKADMERAW